ncbi:hypothetical membrane protein [Brachyspira suanatina]|uniref:Hypothetical membrane protein n=1 Tax=Brachyspira suanatina TaxID=381802 RepID=A0A0G4K6Z8_9SPIR|nr:hypothetical protein [Brachyspira suanatina]CRF33254.1 hypothetical membrane protein [Brachyspira suanatina]
MLNRSSILLMIIFSLFITSCGSYFNPRYYYNKKNISSGNTNESNPDDVGGDETVPEDEDPFKNGPWNDIGIMVLMEMR